MFNWLKAAFGFGEQVGKVIEQERNANNKQHLDLVQEEIKEDKQERIIIEIADDIIFNLLPSNITSKQNKLVMKYKKERLEL